MRLKPKTPTDYHRAEKPDDMQRRDGNKMKRNDPRMITISHRYHSKGAYGNWWVTDADDNRIICMCNRQSDSEEIAKLLNGKGT